MSSNKKIIMKSVSVVISIVLILLMTIALATMTYVWVIGRFTTVSRAGEETIGRVTTGMLSSMVIESTAISKVYLRNTGQNDLTGFKVYINEQPIGSELIVDESKATALSSGKFGYLDIPDTFLSFYNCNGNNQVRVTTAQGTTGFSSLSGFDVVLCEDFNDNVLDTVWTKDIESECTFPECGIKEENNELNISICQNGFSHIERDLNSENIIAQAKVKYTSISGSTAPYMGIGIHLYWDTFNWSSNVVAESQQYFQAAESNGTTSSTTFSSTNAGTTVANKYYWIRIKVNSTHIQHFNSTDGSLWINYRTKLRQDFTLFGPIKKIIIGKGYSSSQSVCGTTNSNCWNPDKDNSYFIPTPTSIYNSYIDDLKVAKIS